MIRLADLASTVAVAALAALVAAAPAGCGDDGNQPPIDAASDADAAPDAATEVRFTGEYISFDYETDQTGANMALVAVHGDPSRMDLAAPNGRFDLQIPATDFVQYDLTPSSAALIPDFIGGTGIVARALAPTGKVSMRTMNLARAADFGFDATKAQVFVHVVGAPHAVAVAAAHDAAYRFDGTAWAAGDTGSDVYIPNVAVGSGTTTVTVTGTTSLPPSVPLLAGKFTYLTALSN